MTLNRTLAVLVLCAGTCALAFGGGDFPIAVSSLRKSSDLVAVCTLKSITTDPSGQTIELQLRQILQGNAASLDLIARVALSRSLRGSGIILSSTSIGSTGVWFLKETASGYQVLSLFQDPAVPNDFFVPISAVSAQAPSTGPIDLALLNDQVQAYESSQTTPTRRDDLRLLESFIDSNPQDAMSVARTMIGSPVLRVHGFGLAVAIRLGSADALSQVAAELDTLKSNPKFSNVLATIRGYPATLNQASVAALEKLIALHSDIPGLDDAASSALAGIGRAATAADSPLPRKAVLPGMALLLDSKDPNGQLRAARFFADFARFADENGIGPFATAATRPFNPSTGSGITPAQYAQFWKTWWAQNYAKMGFTAP
jgi:hypothetical protein